MTHGYVRNLGVTIGVILPYCDSIAIVEVLLQYYWDSSDTIAILLR